MNQWSEEEIKLLHENWDLRWDKLLPMFPERSRSSIGNKIKRLGYTREKKILTEEDYKWISENMHLTNIEMANHLDVSKSVITRALKEMNISTQSYWTQKSIDLVPDKPFSIKIVYTKRRVKND